MRRGEVAAARSTDQKFRRSVDPRVGRSADGTQMGLSGKEEEGDEEEMEEGTPVLKLRANFRGAQGGEEARGEAGYIDAIIVIALSRGHFRVADRIAGSASAVVTLA